MMSPGALLDSCWSADARDCTLMPASRSMSTPSNPNCCIRANALFAKLAALVASLMLTVPFAPPIDRITLRPCECSVWMSLVNWASV